MHSFLLLVQDYSSSFEVENCFFIDSSLPLSIFFQALTLSPQSFPASLVAPMVSILLQNMEPVDNLTWSCMATLSELGREGEGRVGGRKRERGEGGRGEGRVEREGEGRVGGRQRERGEGGRGESGRGRRRERGEGGREESGRGRRRERGEGGRRERGEGGEGRVGESKGRTKKERTGRMNNVLM